MTAAVGDTTDTTATDITTAAVASESTASVRYYPVAPGVALHVRMGPGTQYDIIRTLPVGSRVPIFCQKPGQTVKGPYGTSRIWDNIGNGEFVSDAYVRTGSDGYVAIRC
ncbi:peptidase [Streptomyces qinzhouensis]|uniref:Peptidase n=1 Tax=Streptomyces qinzhouensis TaxID=2599401 RepID=A0A5B8JI17_9ACTN|nr:peptidase [Streptomyces qinzhouensis]